jgi:pyruvate/2-oxoglutarate dehydrogenase complex dihydrolipoamide acyltransferase (E2) component
MPQLNVNDEEVTLVNWCVEPGGVAAEGEKLCEVETSKAIGEIPAPADGVLYALKDIGQEIAVGEVFAYIGPSRKEIDHYINAQQERKIEQADASSSMVGTDATVGAIELARRYAVNLEKIPANGKIYLAEVQAFIERHQLPPVTENSESSSDKADSSNTEQKIPHFLAEQVTEQSPLSDHQYSIATHLARTQEQIVSAYAAMDVDMTAAIQWTEAQRKQGLMTGMIPVCLYGAAAAITREPKLISFRQGRQVYRYNALDIAYTARSGDGRLFTPVVRKVDERSLNELAGEVGRLNMAVFRGNIDSQELSGGSLTVSVLDDSPVRFHIGLQNQFQSAVIAVGAVRQEVRLTDGKTITCPTTTFTLAYDHGLMDGWEAANALSTLKAAIESINV